MESCLRIYSVPQSCLTLCDPMKCSMPGFPVLHHFPECAQTHVHWVGDAIQPSHPLWWKCRVLTTGPPGKFPHRIYFKKYLTLINSVVVVQLLSHVQLFATPWTAACQASLSFTISWGLLKLMSIESVMPSSHLILCHPLLLLPSIFPRTRVISNESSLPSGGQSIGASASALVLPINI